MTMTINLRQTVNRFAKPATRRRYTSGAMVKGYMAAPTYADSPVKGYITPVDGDIQRSLPEGLREHIGLVMYTNDDIRTVGQAAGLQPDGIIYGGQEYQCREVQHHAMQGLFRVLALQLPQPGST